MRRSLDGGVTWEPPKLVVRHEDYGPGPISNFVMIPDRATGVSTPSFVITTAGLFTCPVQTMASTFPRPATSRLPLRPLGPDTTGT